MKKTSLFIVALFAAGGVYAADTPGEDPASRKDYYFGTYARDARVKDNTFITERVDDRPLPDAQLWRTAVPRAMARIITRVCSGVRNIASSFLPAGKRGSAPWRR